jgi:hypothetical protein
MSFQTFSQAPRWSPEPGRTRATIGGIVVDYTGPTPPTLAEVMAQHAPTPAQVLADERTRLKGLFDAPDATMRVLKAVCIVNWNNIPALKQAFPTLAAYAAAVKAQIDLT